MIIHAVLNMLSLSLIILKFEDNCVMTYKYSKIHKNLTYFTNNHANS